jgi:hypothetical protein
MVLSNTRVWSIVGLVLAVSCWITAPLMLGFALGERFSTDPAEMDRIYLWRKVWTTVLMAAFLLGLCSANALAGLTYRQHKVTAIAAWIVGSSLCLLIVLFSVWN